MWGGGLYEAFDDAYSGVIVTRQVYDPEDNDFSDYLDAAETALAGELNAGVLIISFEEAANLIDQAETYDIYNLPWFGSDGTAMSNKIVEDAGEHAAHLGIYSTLAAPIYSSKFQDMSVRYEALTTYEMSFYVAATIDAAWITALAILETKPTYPVEFTATDVIKVLPDVASRYFGYSGWCQLNEAGDRNIANYDIWGYYEPSPEVYDFKKFGYYDYIIDEVIWYP